MNKKRHFEKLIKFARARKCVINCKPDAKIFKVCVAALLSLAILVVPALGMPIKAVPIDETSVEIGFANGEGYEIREMILREYLYGVVFAEIGNNYPIEAIKAQAIVARTFTLMNMSRHSKDGFALCSSSHCQAYKDLSTMSESKYANIKQAVDETSGMVILYEGEMVPVYYFASSGGYTMNIEDVWTAAYPYLRSVKDEYCSGYEWTFEMSFEEIAERMENHDYTVGTIQSIEVSKLCKNGAVQQLLVKSVTDEGEVFENTITKSNIGSVLGSSNFKSNFFSMTGSAENATREEMVGGLFVQGDSAHSRNDETVWVLDAEGNLVEAGFDELNVVSIDSGVNGDGSNDLSEQVSDTSNLSKVATEYVFEHEVVTDGKICISGVGNGHGVGLPQTSARNMANAGYSCTDILHYYFTGITVETVAAN